MILQPCFFLGGLTPHGYVSRLGELTNPARARRVILLRGAPGCGQKVLLETAAQALARSGAAFERICCPLAPQTLDALVSAQVAVIDSAPPHTIEPRCPGVVETTVDLTACLDEAALRERREEVIALTDRIGQLFSQAARYLAAAEALYADNRRLALAATDTAKIERQAERIAKNSFGSTRGEEGHEEVRLLSALTPDGMALLDETARKLAERIVLLEDEHGSSSGLLLAALRRRALAAGLRVIACPAPFAPYERLEHLFLPELSLGFLTAGGLCRPTVEPLRVINARRFTDREALAPLRKRMTAQRKAAVQLLAQAQTLLADAAAAERERRGIYRAACDPSAVDALTQRVLGML